MLKKIGVASIAVGIILGVIGFFTPPYFVIDGSVISFFGEIIGAVGILMAWDSLTSAIQRGIGTKVKAGNTEIEIEQKAEKSNEEAC